MNGFAVVLVVAALLGGVSAQTGIADWDKALAMHNNLRRSLGVPALQWDNTLRLISDAHGQQLAWREGCRLRHIGLDPSKNDFAECLAGGSPANGRTNVDLMTSGVQMWINEGRGGGHYNIMVDRRYKKLGCSTQRGNNCWVVTCNYGL